MIAKRLWLKVLFVALIARCAVEGRCFAQAATRPASPAAQRRAEPAAPASAPLQQGIHFLALDTGDAISHFELSEDGTLLIATHQAADAVSVWDVATGACVKKIRVDSPSQVICRGDSAFVGISSRGAVAVLSRRQEWKWVDELKVPAKGVITLVAPRGQRFDGRILVTGWDEPKPQIGQHGTPQKFGINCLLDSQRDNCRLLNRVGFPTYPSFNFAGDQITELHPGYGHMGMQPWNEYLAEGWKRPPAPTRRLDHSFCAEPASAGGIWAGGSGFQIGDGSEVLQDFAGVISVADRLRPLVYAVGRDKIRAFSASASLPLCGEQPSVLPSVFSEYAESAAEARRPVNPRRQWTGFAPTGASKDVPLVSRPLAVTFGGKCYIFLFDAATGKLFRGSAPAFAENTALASNPAATPAANPFTGTSRPFLAVAELKRVSCMAAMEDGRQLLIGDDAAGKLLVWDVVQRKLVAQVDCPSPRHMICRGERAFVADATNGSLRIFDRTRNWMQVEEFPVRPGLFHVSAARGKYFDGKIISCCGEPGKAAVVLIDLTKHTAQALYEPTSLGAATVDYRGETLLVQSQLLNASPRGIVTPYLMSQIMAPGNAMIRSETVHRDFDYLRQCGDLPIWGDGKVLLAGDPPTIRLNHFTGRLQDAPLAIPDEMRPAIYAVSGSTIEVRRADRTYGLLSSTPTEAMALFPAKRRDEPASKGMGGIGDPTRFTCALAMTIDHTTHLFVADDVKAMWRCEIPETPVGRQLPSRSAPTTLPATRQTEMELLPPVTWAHGVANHLLVADGQSLRVLSGTG